MGAGGGWLWEGFSETKPEGRVGVTQVKSEGEAFQADGPAFAEALRCKSTQHLLGTKKRPVWSPETRAKRGTGWTKV